MRTPIKLGTIHVARGVGDSVAVGVGVMDVATVGVAVTVRVGEADGDAVGVVSEAPDAMSGTYTQVVAVHPAAVVRIPKRIITAQRLSPRRR